MNKFTGLLLVVFLTYCQTAFADKEKKYKGTVLNISASEFSEVEEDLLIAALRFEDEGKHPQQVQENINNAMQKALAEAEYYKTIKSSTENYSLNKYYPDQKKDVSGLPMWRGRQSIALSGKVPEDLLILAGKLQQKNFVMESLSYTVSNEKREEIRDSLIEQAIAKLISKGQRVAKALGKDKIKVINMNVDNDTYQPYHTMNSVVRNRGITKSEMLSPPIAAPGRAGISMTVSASILIED